MKTTNILESTTIGFTIDNSEEFSKTLKLNLIDYHYYSACKEFEEKFKQKRRDETAALVLFHDKEIDRQ
jgi:hypothetical protein